jgi:hypothetical protein
MLQRHSKQIAMRSSVTGKYDWYYDMKQLDEVKASILNNLEDPAKASASSHALTAENTCFDSSAWLHRFLKEPTWTKHSQGDQDAVLASLFSPEALGTTNKKFVEFGFPDDGLDTSYGNGRNLVETMGFQPQLLMDGAHENSDINLHKRFVTAENVVALFDEFQVPLDADYVSVDIDSCDVWVAHAILEKYRPRVMTVEYNANHAFGDYTALRCADPQADGAYYWQGDNIFGASMSAIALAAQHRNYSVIYVTERLDVFLVPNELLCPGTVPPLDAFKPTTSLRHHGEYSGQFGPKDEVLTNFSDWLTNQDKA